MEIIHRCCDIYGVTSAEWKVYCVVAWAAFSCPQIAIPNLLCRTCYAMYPEVRWWWGQQLWSCSPLYTISVWVVMRAEGICIWGLLAAFPSQSKTKAAPLPLEGHYSWCLLLRSCWAFFWRLPSQAEVSPEALSSSFSASSPIQPLGAFPQLDSLTDSFISMATRISQQPAFLSLGYLLVSLFATGFTTHA